MHVPSRSSQDNSQKQKVRGRAALKKHNVTIICLALLFTRQVEYKQPVPGSEIVGSATRGGGYSHTLPKRVCAAQRDRDFEAPDIERGIHFRGVF